MNVPRAQLAQSNGIQLRNAAKKVIDEVNNLRLWRGLETSEIDGTACWREIGRRWLPALLGVLDALRAARQTSPIGVDSHHPPPAPRDLSLIHI